MAIVKITYQDKILGQANPNPPTQKWQFGDANEVKQVVNNNADELDALVDDTEDLDTRVTDNTNNILANQSDILDRQQISEKGQANGYASLDGSGKIPLSEIPSTVNGGIRVIGFWNAATNVPDLSALTLEQGEAYQVSISGNTNLNGETNWRSKDLAVWSDILAGNYFKLDNTDDVISVAGKTGVVTLTVADITDIASNYLSLSGGTLTGPILGDQSARLYRPQSSSIISVDSNLSTLDINTRYIVDTSLTDITITIDDLFNFNPVGTVIEFIRSGQNNLIFNTSGSQNLQSADGFVKLRTDFSGGLVTKINNNNCVLIGDLKP